ncbi:drug resistance transporter, EmrB/QacA subfamily [Streptomyces sp. DI166]|uniref:MFS transporter n=1 Tax=Streptomyces sp. DI166 TaxID=1839783 RepID=UPI0007F40D6B|nr:MFS transporter [Streptomyces sp. DI166]SBT93728.1 drug resistance transporter, EmrB/QacA subfamily [Streptomyces sp. DI166]
MSSRSASRASSEAAPGTRRRGALAVLLLASFMGILDVLIVNVAAPSIQRDLHAGFADIQAVISGYVLAYAVLLTTGARLGDSYGHKRVFLLGVLGFTTLSAGCAAAPSAGVLIALRLLQGMAAALMLPQVLALIQVIFPPDRRARPLALYGATLGLGAVLGQIIGGALIRADVFGLGWRSVFLVNVPIGLAVAACVPATLPKRGPAARHPLDIPGLLLTAVAMTLLIFPLVRGSADGWPGWVWPALTGSALALVALWFTERRRESAGGAPLVPPSLFRVPGFRIGLAIALIFYSGNYGLFLLLAYVFQDGLHLSPLASGIAFLPLGVGFAAASLASRRLTARYGSRVLLIGAGTMVIGYVVLLATLAPGPASSGPREALALAPALLLSGAGQGFVSAPLIGVVLATVRREDAGAGSGIMLTANQLASSLGVAVLGALFVALLGADPQDSGAGLGEGDFTAALLGCSWALLALAAAVGFLARRLPRRGAERGSARPTGPAGSTGPTRRTGSTGPTAGSPGGR